MATVTVGAPFGGTWKSINWKEVEKHVNRLQMRIAKAIKAGHHHKVKALQWLLTHSFFAKLLAVRRISQNRGKNTPGIDNVTLNTPEQKMKTVASLTRRGYKPSPVKRIHIPKRNGKLRPLGISTKIDLAQQALHLLALEPVAETLADRNSYGFRPKRSLHDAIDQCFKVLSRKGSAQYILEGDIKACFDEIAHEWLETHAIMDKKILKKWLAAGYIDKHVFHETMKGLSQGSAIAPCLANMVLDGLEETIRNIAQRSDKINYVRYADDWICTADSKETLERQVIPVITNFLKERGLELSKEKTKITNIHDGFDFLGCNIRKFNNKLIIKPYKNGVKSFLSNIRETVKSNYATTTENLINILNPKIQGWANHYSRVVAKKTFSYVDHNIFKIVWKWAKRRHRNKGFRWVKEKYFTRINSRDWMFFSNQKKKGIDRKIFLKFASDTRIKRHVKIRADANPYDANFKSYFQQRTLKQRMSNYNRTVNR